MIESIEDETKGLKAKNQILVESEQSLKRQNKSL